MKITVIFGVPGSGKTTWLANKYAELLNTYEPSDIVFLSYTKRQVTHGKRKVKGKTHINMSKLTSFQTVHALSKKSYNRNYEVLDDVIGFKMSKFLDVDMLPVIRGINYMKNTMTDNDAVGANKAGMDLQTFQKRKFFYESVKSGLSNYEQMIDFADMIENAINTNYKNPAKVLILDEAQDFSPLQWRAIYSAFKDVEEMYVAGDPMQALYRFSGGFSNYMYEMRCDETIILDKSYRCCKPVADMATLISRKMERHTEFIVPKPMRDCFAVFYPDKNIFPLFSAVNYSRRHGYKVMILANTYYQLELTKKKLLGKYQNYPHHFFAGRKREFYRGGEKNALIFSTVHQAKGQEADIVLYNCSCGSVDEFTDFGTKKERLDDYWKLVYTGITRAKRGLVVFQLTNPTVDEPNCLDTLYYCKFNYDKYKEWFAKKGNTKHLDEYVTELQDNTC